MKKTYKMKRLVLLAALTVTILGLLTPIHIADIITIPADTHISEEPSFQIDNQCTPADDVLPPIPIFVSYWTTNDELETAIEYITYGELQALENALADANPCNGGGGDYGQIKLDVFQQYGFIPDGVTMDDLQYFLEDQYIQNIDIIADFLDQYGSFNFTREGYMGCFMSMSGHIDPPFRSPHIPGIIYQINGNDAGGSIDYYCEASGAYGCLSGENYFHMAAQIYIGFFIPPLNPVLTRQKTSFNGWAFHAAFETG